MLVCLLLVIRLVMRLERMTMAMAVVDGHNGDELSNFEINEWK